MFGATFTDHIVLFEFSISGLMRRGGAVVPHEKQTAP